MCGIAGIVSPDARDCSYGNLQRMILMIGHRGPDDAGSYTDGQAGLAHARLSIIDIANGRQPMSNADGSLLIVFNGEIFNYLELRDELAAKGHRFATRSDTEVILHLFEEMGESAVTRLNGQWALAIWNRREKRLFLSRDRMGVRPLFYTFSGKRFIFASEIKGLFACPGVSRKLDLRSLDQVFTFWHTISPRTVFEDVFELPPGHSAILQDGRLTIRPYWELNYPAAPSGPPAHDEQAYAEQLLDLLKDAARIRLRADVPVGAYLSGGLDSTLIAALANQFAGSRLKTFSVRFSDPELDESSFQRQAVQYLGTDHAGLRCSEREIGEAFPEVIWHTETPILRTGPAPLYLLAKLVRECGYKVVLTGEGADEMLGGYDIFKEYKIRRFWSAHADSTWRPLLLKKLYPYLKNLGSQPAAYLNGFFQVNSASAGDPFFSHSPRWRLAAGLKMFYSRGMRAELDSREAFRELEQLLPPAFAAWDGFSRAEYLEARHLLPGYILSSQGDRVAMAHAVEGRFPFLDYRVVEFAAGLPPTLKMKALQEKYLLKRCARGLVPPAVIGRHKQPYRAPEAQSFFPDGRPLPYVEELLAPRQIRQDGIFDPDAVQKLVEKTRNGDIIGIRDNMALVGIISTTVLMRRFLTGFSAGEEQEEFHGRHPGRLAEICP